MGRCSAAGSLRASVWVGVHIQLSVCVFCTCVLRLLIAGHSKVPLCQNLLASDPDKVSFGSGAALDAKAVHKRWMRPSDVLKWSLEPSVSVAFVLGVSTLDVTSEGRNWLKKEEAPSLDDCSSFSSVQLGLKEAPELTSSWRRCF